MWTEETSLNIDQAIYHKTIVKYILSGEKLKTFPLRSGIRQGHPFSPLISWSIASFSHSYYESKICLGIPNRKK